MRVAARAPMGEDRTRLAGARDSVGKGCNGGNGDAEEEVPEVRGLLLQEEHAVRAEPRRAVPHLPTARTRTQAGASARVRLPHRAHARRLRVPAGERTLLRAPRPALQPPR